MSWNEMDNDFIASRMDKSKTVATDSKCQFVKNHIKVAM